MPKLKFNVMDQTGHSVEELDAETRNGTSEAMQRFAELTQERKMTAAAKRQSGKTEIVRSFDQIGTATEVVFVPQLVGG